MKRFLALFGIFILFITSTEAASIIPHSVANFVETILAIITQKPIYLSGVTIITISAIWSLFRKSWTPIAYVIVSLIIIVLALPFVESMLSWRQTLSNKIEG